ncbi:DoxX family protein [Hyphomicrobium sp. 2TAF46]|uniref:DoxX family protein n=1 Tax=Hyphomicrobium sp. 2TAF46 TaxID=3233019 RepID=UPI003F93705C
MSTPKSAGSAADHPSSTANRSLWIGRGMKALVVLFLCFDAVIKIMFVPDMPEASAGIGWDAAKAPLLGVILLASTLLYAVPRTSVLGAILLTGYLGGAVATHMRVDSPLFTHVLFGIYLGLFMWGGLWLRDPRLRSLFPLRRSAD